MLLAGTRAPVVGILLCAACYVPGLVLGRRAATGFDRAGTDRVMAANGAAWQVFGTAIAGLVYVAVVLVLVVGMASLRGPTDA
jgi:hypothetical protein